MSRTDFDTLFGALAGLTLAATELARLRAWLAGIVHPGECIALIEQAAAHRPCPHCRCSRLQRLRCLGCRRTCNALTGTPLARLRKKEKWLPYLQCALESRTVRDSAAAVGVHRTTSFRWRHRFIPGAARRRPQRLSSGSRRTSN